LLKINSNLPSWPHRVAGMTGRGAAKEKEKQMMNRLKSICSIVAILALFVVPVSGQAAKLPKDLLVFASTDSVTTWDPSASYSVELTYMANVYEPLIWVSPPGSDSEFEPALAERWEAAPDGLQWTFYLRKGVQFHDGGTLSAQTVKDSFERTMALKKGASFILSPIKEIKVLDELTVQFILSSAAPFDRIAASAYAAWIISPNAVKNEGEWFDGGKDAGSGPYVIESYKPDEEIIFKKFDGYWKGWEGQHFDRIVVKIIKEATVQEQLIDAGAADLGNRVPIESSRAFNEKECCERISGPSYMNYAIHLNTAIPPFDNKLVRQAASYAISYEAMLDIGLAGLGRQGVGPVPFGQFGHDDTLHQYKHDPEKAKKLMAEAGFADGIKEPVIFTYAAENAVEKAIAPLVKEDLAKIGINVDVRPMIWTAQWDLVKGGPEKAQHMAALLWWPTFSDPYETLFSLWHVEEKPAWNFAYYKNPDFDKALNEAYATPDAAAAQALYTKAQKMLVEDAPSIFLFDVERPVFKQKGLKGVAINPAYPRVPFWYDMYKE
jgi:peptide/nickel transport system substrate-binding protein